MKARGSATLVIVIISAALLLSTTALWRGVSLSLESALHCYRAKKHYCAAQSLAMYGIALLKNRVIALDAIKPLKDVVIYKGPWPKGSKTFGHLLVNYNPKQNLFKICAKLFDGNGWEPIMTANVECLSKGKAWQVVNWQ